MKTNLSLEVAAALLAGASSANAGIMIPAGDWTLDIGGIVNTYYTSTRTSGEGVGTGYGSLIGGNGSNDALAGGSEDKTQSNITTGLLPNYLSVSGKTRQNDLDVGFTISINPGSSTTQAGIQNGSTKGRTVNQENRQAFVTFGDKSWGSIKIGKDLGIFASDAILNDMTLLGVGSGAGGLAGNTTTLGRIGTGFVYADWKSQIAYSSPNWNGFSFTAGVTQAFNAINVLAGATSTGRGGSEPAFEAKASYEWAGDVGGKVWVSGISQKIDAISTGVTGVTTDDRANAFDIGATVNLAGFGLTGYYYDGEGIGQTVQFNGGYDASGNARDSQGYYVQGTYTLPGVGTKLGVSYGESETDANSGDTIGDIEDSMWTVGAYHPLTKHLNLVAEYSHVKVENGSLDGKGKTISLGAILFF